MKTKADFQKKLNQMAVSFNHELVKLLHDMNTDITRCERRISKIEKKLETHGKKR